MLFAFDDIRPPKVFWDARAGIVLHEPIFTLLVYTRCVWDQFSHRTRFPLRNMIPDLKHRSSVGDKEAYSSGDISIAGGRFRLKLPKLRGGGK
jgi:hypothetical protein